MNKNGKKNNSSGAFVALVFFCGIAIGFVLYWLASKLFQFHGFDEWSFSTDPVNAVISVLTLLAAFTILRRFQRQDEASSKTRGLLAEYLAEFRADYRTAIINLVGRPSVNALEVIQRITRFKTRALMLIALGKDHGLLEKGERRSPLLKKSFDNMRRLLTETSVPGATATGGNIVYSEQRKSDVAAEIYETEKLIFTITALIHN